MMNIGPELDIESLNNIIVNSILNAAEKHIPKVKEKLKRDNNFDAQTVEVLKTRGDAIALYATSGGGAIGVVAINTPQKNTWKWKN